MFHFNRQAKLDIPITYSRDQEEWYSWGGGGGGGVRMFALEKFVTELLNYSQFNGFREGSG